MKRILTKDSRPRSRRIPAPWLRWPCVWPSRALSFVLLLSGALLPGPAARSASSLDRGRQGVEERPLFVENIGQFERAARFRILAGDTSGWLTRDALWLTYSEPAQYPGASFPASSAVPVAPGGALRASSTALTRRGVHLRLTFPGIDAHARLVPTHARRTRMNYFLGDDRRRWRSGVPTYGALQWKGIHQGISLDFREMGDDLALIVETTPPVAPASLRLRVDGADSVQQYPDGRLVALTAIGSVLLPPILFEGRALRARIDGSDIAFPSLGPPLQPRISGDHVGSSGLLYGTFLGASEDEFPFDVALGLDGSIYVAGSTNSPDFPTTPGAFDTGYDQGQFGGDAFVSKLDPTGSSLIYSTFLGGSDTESPPDLAVGPGGGVFLAGYTYAEDFPTTPGAYSPEWKGGCCDGFVAKLNARGSKLVFSTFLGGESFDDIEAIAISPDRVVHVTGETLSRDFPTTRNAFDRIINNDGEGTYSDVFATALNGDGGGLVHSTFLGGRYNDRGRGITVDARGEEYVTGQAQSPDFPTTPRAFDTTFNGGGAGDGFVTKLDQGSSLSFSTYLGGYDDEDGTGLGIDAARAVYVVGSTSSPNFPVTPGAFDTTINSFIFSDVFATKLDATGRALRYSTFLGGADSDFGLDVSVHPDETISFTGTTFSTDFPTTGGAFDRTRGGPADAFVTRLDAMGGALISSTYVGGTARVVDTGHGIDRGGGSVVYVTGTTFSEDFPTTPGAYDTTYDDRFDAFVVALKLHAATRP